MGSTEAPPKEHTGRAGTDEDLPGDEGANGREEVTQLSIQGDNDLTSKIGGRRPDEATIKLAGGEFGMGKTQFDKGQRVRLVIEGVIDDVGERDHRDRKTGTVTNTVKKHTLTVDHVEKVPLVEDKGAGA